MTAHARAALRAGAHQHAAPCAPPQAGRRRQRALEVTASRIAIERMLGMRDTLSLRRENARLDCCLPLIFSATEMAPHRRRINVSSGKRRIARAEHPLPRRK